MGLNPVFPGHPRQGWQFTVRVNGIEAAKFQKATLPEISVEVDEFASGGSVRNHKYAGRKTIGTCTLEKGMFADGADLEAWAWLTQTVNSMTGNQGSPANYWRDVDICHVDRVGRVIQTWHMTECFVSQLTWSDNEGTSSEHVVETLTLTVGDCVVI